MSLPRRQPETRCGSCGGSGYFAGTYGDIECVDCGGEGTWAKDEPPKPARKPCVPSPEYLAWLAKVDADKKELIALRDADSMMGDPGLHLEPKRKVA